MATTTTKIIESLNTSNGWLQASNITGTWGCYVIGVKGEPITTDTFNINDLKYVVLEIGIDSGISGKPITLTRIKLNFNEETSLDKELNSKTALTKLTQMPSTIYLKPVAFADQTKEYLEGKMNVSINVIPF